MIRGTDGDNVLHGVGGNDIFDGGAGNHAAEFLRGRQPLPSSTPPATTRSTKCRLDAGINLDLPFKRFGAVDRCDWKPTALAIENGAVGTAQADSITGGSLNNILIGLGGNDRLLGQSGHDVLIGGDGDDELNGGSDQDIAVVAGPIGSIPALAGHRGRRFHRVRSRGTVCSGRSRCLRPFGPPGSPPTRSPSESMHRGGSRGPVSPVHRPASDGREQRRSRDVLTGVSHRTGSSPCFRRTLSPTTTIRIHQRRRVSGAS